MTNSTGTPATKRSERPSDEADKKQLELAKREGAQYLAALDYMTTQVAETGAKTEAGDYIVAFAQEGAEGMYHLIDGALAWVEAPPGTNCHIEIAVLDACDHRFIPYLTIDCTLSQGGNEIVKFRPEFLWHPGLFHYGKDVQVPGDSVFDLHVSIAAPTFPRHDKLNGRRYASHVDVVFKAVTIKTGRG